VEIDKIKYFISFIGWGRSGNSLVAALLNFHPNIYIKNEFVTINKFYKTQDQIFKNILEKIEKKRKRGGQSWGGFKHRDFKDMYNGDPIVVGGKKGGKTSNDLHNTPKTFESGTIVEGRGELFKKIYDEVIKVPVKWINVQRNPYDNISTFVKNGWKPDEAIEVYFWQAQSVEKVLKERDCISVKLEDVIGNTEYEIQRLCNHLEITTYKNYLSHCRSVAWNKPRKTRHNASFWNKKRIKEVKDKMKKYDFISGYSYGKTN
jgi:hypothetical protein